MQLTLEEAAARLGKSERQVRYLIKTKRLPAKKLAGRWVIESEDLKLSEGQTKAAARKDRQLRSAVEEGLGLGEEGGRAPRYSVRDLKAFQIALPIYRRAVEHLGAEHPAGLALRGALEYLTRGCHRFDNDDKAQAYRQARDAASLAVCELALSEDPKADEMIHEIEQELMAALAGLLRRLERRRQR